MSVNELWMGGGPPRKWWKKKQSIICYQDQVDAWVNLKQYVLAYSPEKGQLEILKYSCTGFFFFKLFILYWSIADYTVVVQKVKSLTYNERDPGSIPGLGRSPRGGNGNSLQCFCLENPWTEEPGRLQSMGSQRVSQDWSNFISFHSWLTMLW